MLDHRLADLTGLKPIFFLPEDDLLQEVIIPCFTVSTKYDCMTGFFDSGSLREMAPGLAEFIGHTAAQMRLLVSPYLTRQDQRALKEGLNEAPKIIARKLDELYGSAKIDSSALVKHTLICLAYLLATGMIEMKVVVVKNGLFHPKIRIFSDGAELVALHGSNNLTIPGLTTNMEQVVVSRSWSGGYESQIVERIREDFDKIWNNMKPDYTLVFDLPKAFEKNIVADFSPESPPTSEDFWKAWEHDSKLGIVTDIEQSGPGLQSVSTKPSFDIPAWIEYDKGDFSHQIKAVEAWEKAGGRGILAMATGAGKTITSLIAGRRLFETTRSLLIIVAAPTIPLVHQWEKEAKEFGLEVNVPGKSSSKREKLSSVQSSIRNLKHGVSRVECLVITHNLLCDDSFHKEVESFEKDVLLIADEVHNLGTPSFLNSPLDLPKYRIGLSATPEREFDPEGTEQLEDYFGDVVYRFTLEEAIGKCLVPYEYYIHPVELTIKEMEEWIELTIRLNERGWQWGTVKDEKDKIPPGLQALIRKRRLLLEQADRKLDVLRSLLEAQDLRRLKHVLVYASAKERGQLSQVNKMLMNDLRVRVHQITYDENKGKTNLTDRLLDDFASGDGIQVLTAMRVLDEGIDIPEVSTAYILASTTVERQWIQRRGRLLRKCSRINKEKAFLHDFVVVPSANHMFRNVDADITKILKGELERVVEFSKTSLNAATADGALMSAKPILEDFFLT